MSSGEVFYLVLVLATFGGFGLWLAYNSARFERSQKGKPAVRYREDSHHAAHESSHA